MSSSKKKSINQKIKTHADNYSNILKRFNSSKAAIENLCSDIHSPKKNKLHQPPINLQQKIQQIQYTLKLTAQRYQKQVLTLKHSNQILANDLDKQSCLLREQQNIIQQMKNTLQKQDIFIDNLKDENNKLVTEVKKKSLEMEQLENQFAKRVSEIKSKYKKIKHQKYDIQTQANQKNYQYKFILESNRTAEKQREEIIMLNKELKHQNDEMKKQLNKVDLQQRQIRKELQKSEEVTKKYIQLCKNYQHKIQKIQKEIKWILESQKQSEKEKSLRISELQNRNNELQVFREKYQELKNRTKDEMQVYIHEVEQIKKQNKKLKKEKQEFKQQKQLLTKKLQVIQENMNNEKIMKEEHTKILKQLQAQLNLCYQERKKGQIDSQRLQRINVQNTIKIDQLNKSLFKRQEKYKCIEKQKIRLQKQIENIEKEVKIILEELGQQKKQKIQAEHQIKRLIQNNQRFQNREIIAKQNYQQLLYQFRKMVNLVKFYSLGQRKIG